MSSLRRARRRAWPLALLALTAWGLTQAPPQPTTPIHHFIVLMQENHSFDNYFGHYPGADGIPEGTCLPSNPFVQSGGCVAPFRIGENDVEMDDPDHSTATAWLQYNDGAMNGFVYALNLRNQDGRLAMGYYDERDLPYYYNLADAYVLFDRFFSSAMGGSFINHLYWVAAAPGATEGQNQQAVLAETPTIFDRLEAAGVTWKFYVQNYEPALTYRTVSQFPGNRSSQVTWVPLLNFDRFLDDPELSRHIVDLSEYFGDLSQGTLPAVAFIVPSGPSEHPPSSLRSGQRFVKNLLQALSRSPYWERSAFMWTYDDWGGWYDHVPPPQVDEHGYGFRVPALLVSPYAKVGHVEHATLDYTSILRFIEDNWGLAPLAARDAAAQSVAGAFDFSQPPRPATFFPFERVTEVAAPAPRRFIIYAAYSVALLIFGAAALMARYSARRESPKEGANA